MKISKENTMALPAILAGLIPDLIGKGVALIDKKWVTEGEKQEALQEYQRDAENRLQEAWDKEQEQLTERHKNDMTSDSWWSKNIRPMVLVYLMVLFTLGFFREIPENVLDLLGDLLMTAFVFYFGSRTIEKMTSMIKGK